FSRPSCFYPPAPPPIYPLSLHDALPISEWLETLRASTLQTGLQAAIWHEGELVAEVAVGPADEPAGIPLRTTHRLRIASHSKMIDRKSTRLNSSHVKISYAVFCLKKKNK